MADEPTTADFVLEHTSSDDTVVVAPRGVLVCPRCDSPSVAVRAHGAGALLIFASGLMLVLAGGIVANDLPSAEHLPIAERLLMAAAGCCTIGALVNAVRIMRKRHWVCKRCRNTFEASLVG